MYGFTWGGPKETQDFDLTCASGDATYRDTFGCTRLPDGTWSDGSF